MLEGKIILLDLNYTLVSNSAGRYPFTESIIEAERYRQWLVEAVKNNKVIIITVRNKPFEKFTLEKIKEHTGWQPTDSYFPVRFEQGGAPNTKAKGLSDYIFPKYGSDKSKYLAIESNPKTTAMYKFLGIEVMTQGQLKKGLDSERNIKLV